MPIRAVLLLVTAMLLPAFAPTASAQVHTVSSETDLRSAIAALNPGDSIVFNASITLTADLPSIAQNVTILGNGFTLSGADQFRGLMIVAVDSRGVPQPVDVAVQDLTIANTVAVGGAGGDGAAGGGGGAGLGGAIFVASQANVTLSNVTVVSSQAVGGSGGVATAGAGGGGGGLGGAGGAGTVGAAGGGGGVGTAATGGTNSGAGGDGILTGAFPAGSSSGGGAGGLTGGGGGSGGQGGGGGGASGGAGVSGFGGAGGYGGGAGGGTGAGFAASGGFGGGGGGAVASNGGAGGYGAGGGGTSGNTASGGPGGLFGGNGTNSFAGSGGGGGAGLGGAIFVQGGGSISITGLTVNGSAVTGGDGTTAGGAHGAGLFLAGSGFVTFGAGAGVTSTIADQIADETGALGLVGLGSWAIQKDGAGTLVLTGTNLYSGGTTVNAGTLQVGGASNVGSGSISLFGPSALSITGSSTFTQDLFLEATPLIQVAAGQSVTWSGGIHNVELGGQLQLGGGGTLSLTNAGNTYTGGTVVFGGSTLLVTGDGALGDAAGGVTLGDATTAGTLAIAAGSTMSTTRAVVLGAGGGIFDTQGSATLTVNGNISGSGALTKSGNGTLILGSVNTYTGATNIDAGILRAGTSGAVSAGAMTIQFGAQLDLAGFDQTVGSLSGNGQVTLGSATLTAGGDNTSTSFLGPIVGTGALVKTGTGSLTLTGINTYSGGTTVSAGSLIGNTGSLQGNILNNAAVEFAQATAGTYAGAMSGTGSLAKSGAGTLTLSGANSYTGGTTVTGGVLVGTTTSLQGNIFNGGTVVFDQASSGTYAGSMTGTGQLEKLGAGVLTLAAASSYTGVTNLVGGVLQAGAVNVFSAGSTVQLGAGTTLDLNGLDQSVGGLSGSGSVTLGAGSLTVGSANTSTFDGTISGAGALIKAGTGSLTLTGAQAYLGGTTVAGGSLIGSTVSLQGNILNNAQVVFDQGSSGTYAGAMSGTGALLKTGAGALTLSGANSYSGGTTVAAGSLIGTSISLQGNILNQTLVIFDQSFDGLFAGSVAGTGALVKSGTGTLTLGGPLSHTGGTIVTGGTLAAGATDVFQGALSLADGAGLAFNGFDQTIDVLSGGGNISLGGAQLTTGGGDADGAFAGTITGSGSLLKVGAGTLLLTGANSYSGGTTVAGGTLLGTTTSIQGNILNNALVVFDQSADGTYAGSMSGSGSLAKLGSGTLTLTGANSYTGGTLISGGTLAGTTSSLTGTIFNDASLLFTGDADGTFSGTLAGGGSVTKTGLGTLSLNGAHPMSGLFTVGQGTLSLAGSLGGSISVQSGARLLAAPSASPATSAAMDGAPLAASSGNSITGDPLVTIAGNLSLLPGSIFSLPVGLGPVASVLVGGVAVIDQAQLDVVPLDIGTQRTTSFLALTALDGLSMTGAVASTQNPLLLPFLRQDANSLFVTLINLGIPLASVASTGNAASVGAAIDEFKLDATGDAGFIARELSALDDGALDEALQLVAGEVHASSLQVVIRDSEGFTDMIRNELAARDRESEGPYFTDGQSVRWWSQIGGERNTFDGTGGVSGGTINVGTGAGGFDWKLSDRWTIGGGAGFGLGTLSLTDRPASTDFKAPRAFGYAGFRPGGFGLKAGGSFARSKSNTNRNIIFRALLPQDLGGAFLTDGVNREAVSEEIALVSDQWSEYDDDMDVKTYRFEWFVGLRRAQFSRKGFTENGAGALSLLLPDQTFTLRQADVKVHVWRTERDVRPFFEALYRREMTNGRTTTRLEFADVPGSAFTIEGLPVPGHTFSGRAGVTFMTWLGAWTFEYQARYATGQFAHAGDIRVRFK